MAENDDTKVQCSEEHIELASPQAEEPMPSPEQQEAAVKKRYGGLMPKKPPLISKDHERAYFDSADWALGKGGQPGQKPKTLIEKLRPKLQPTPHQPLPARRTSYESAENEEDGEPFIKEEDKAAAANDEVISKEEVITNKEDL